MKNLTSLITGFTKFALKPFNTRFKQLFENDPSIDRGYQVDITCVNEGGLGPMGGNHGIRNYQS
mgnify:CR=1 FL=1